jgi:hypothetical protein
MLGPAITVGGLLGERKRVLLGAETAFSVQPAASSSKLTVSLWRLGFLSMVRFPLGSKRATIIAVGGQFGVGLESLHSSADPPLVQCGLDRDGLQSLRATALFVPRFTTTFLLGSTKRHGLNLRLDAGVAVMGEGRADRTSAQCTGPMAAERPFAEVGLTRAAALFAAFGLGYTLLF